MKPGFRILIIIIFILVLFSACVGFAATTTTVNRAVDFKWAPDGNPAGFALLIEGAPRYSLKPVSEGRVLLTLYDTETGPRLKKRKKTDKDQVVVEKDSPGTLVFQIPLGAPVREIRTSWLGKEKNLLLSLYRADKERPATGTPGKPVTLKRLRFGIQDSLTRMVADLDRKPPWELVHGAKDRLTLRIEAGRMTLKKKNFKGLRRIKEVSLQKKDHQVSLDLSLDPARDHFRIFWLQRGRKLVTDLLDQPLAPVMGMIVESPDEEGPEGVEVAAKEADQNLAAEEPNTVAATKIVRVEPIESPITVKIESGKEQSDEKGYFVRGKIRSSGGSLAPVERRAIVSTPRLHNVDIRVVPEIGNTPPEGLYNREWVHHLSSEQAFLIGRIQEAWETRSYEKGVELIDRFLAEFPDSPLYESMSFLVGDFGLVLLKMGKKEVHPKVIESYSKAVSRFGGSGRVPTTYVRMAQADAFMGMDYEAVGYINMALGQFKEGDHLPSAYLTRGKIYLRLNQPEKAVEDLKTVITRFPRSPAVKEARYEIAKYFYSIGTYDEAEKRFREIADEYPQFHLDYPEYLSVVAQNYDYQKNYQSARDYYFKALNLGRQPETGDMLLSRIGDTYHHQQRERDAEKFYRAAIEFDPDSEGAGIARLRLAEYSSGVTAFKEIHEENINRPIGDLALLNLAKRFYEQKQYPMAMDTLRNLIENPNQADILEKAQALYARAIEEEVKKHYRNRDYEKVVLLQKAQDVTLSEDLNPEVDLMTAQSYYQLEQYQHALVHFTKIRPYDLMLTSKGAYFLDMADSLIKGGEEEEAIRVLENSDNEKLLPVDRQKIMALLASLRRRNGDLKGAHDLYEALIKERRMLPDLEIAEAYLAMGEISNLERRYEKAREALNRCIALAEKDRDGRGVVQSAYIALGNGYHREGNHKQAVRLYEKGLDLGYGPEKGDYWEISYRLALSYLKTGNNARAEQLFNAVSEEGDPILQQKVQIKMGMIDLQKQLKRLPVD